jgi:hypothetical protein
VLIMRHGSPPPTAAPYADIVINYILSQFWNERSRTRRRLRKQGANANAGMYRAYHALKQSLTNLKAALNHNWYELDGTLVHWCVDAGCCQGYDREVCASKIARALRATLFRRIPTVPKSNKWTVLGPCNDFFVFGVLVHNVMPHVYTLAFSQLSADVALRSQTVHVAGQKMTADFFQDINWHAVAGRRMLDGLRLLQDY